MEASRSVRISFLLGDPEFLGGDCETFFKSAVEVCVFHGDGDVLSDGKEDLEIRAIEGSRLLVDHLKSAHGLFRQEEGDADRGFGSKSCEPVDSVREFLFLA